ncbi:MAG: hypothetical protein AAGG45_10680, partial [Pseudomonadota bacterium]
MEVKVVTGASLSDAKTKLDGFPADFVSAHVNCEAKLSSRDRVSIAGALHGSSSCLGAMTHEGKADHVAIFALSDSAGAYGTGLADFSDGPRIAAKKA